MAHPQDTNYIIKVIADSWDSSFCGSPGPDPSTGTYNIIDNKTGDSAATQGYTTAHTYPAAILAICPNAPDATYTEVLALLINTAWTGA